MNDMSSVITPKSDQLNSENLIAGPITVTITKVAIRGGQEQPVSVSYSGDDNKPFKPCKSMCKVMVDVWGLDANAYVGHSMTLYNDPKVTYGSLAVGGIRISHMTGLKERRSIALTETKGRKKVFTVYPLKVESQGKQGPEPEQTQQQTQEPKKSFREILKEKLTDAKDMGAVMEIMRTPSVAKILTDGPDDKKVMVNALLDEARARIEAAEDATPPTDTAPPPADDDDMFPGDKP